MQGKSMHATRPGAYKGGLSCYLERRNNMYTKRRGVAVHQQSKVNT